MKSLPNYCLEVNEAVIVVQSCDEETANIGVQWRGKISYCRVALPSLEREWQKWYYSDVRPEIFDSILRENKHRLLEFIRRLNAAEHCLHPTDGTHRQIDMFSTEAAGSVSKVMTQKQYWLMDGRANYDVSAAYVLECCQSLKEAKRNINNYGADTCIVDAETQEVVDSLMWRGLTKRYPTRAGA